jgi:hypothetical protein
MPSAKSLKATIIAKNPPPLVPVAGKTRLIWERAEGETTAQYLRFCTYRDWPHEHDGEKRSLRKATANHGDGGNSAHLVSVLSSQFNWPLRAAAYDDYMEGRLRKRLEESRLRMKERQVKLGISMQDMAQTSLQTGVIQPESVSDIVKLAESGTRIERLAQGESTENVAQGVSVVWSGPAPPWAPQLASTVAEPSHDAQKEETADVEDAEWSEVAE